MALETATDTKVISFEERKYELLWRFWFGSIEHTKEYFDQRMRLWFEKNHEFDSEIKERFLDWFEDLENWDLEKWKKYPRGTIALLILTDQVPRNAFRGTFKMFQYDSIARDLAVELCKSGKDLNYDLAERLFIYLPLEHSENLKDQDLAVQKFEDMLAEVSLSMRPIFQELLEYALRHRDIIYRFGRFPHRNQVMNRISSPDELDFLKTPGSSF